MRLRQTTRARPYRSVSPPWASATTSVGLGGLEPPTSSLSGKRSNRLSYRPANIAHGAPGPGLQIHRRRDHRGYRTANTTPNRRRAHPRTLAAPSDGHQQQRDPGNHPPRRPTRVHEPLTPPQRTGNNRPQQVPESPLHQRFSLRHRAFWPSRIRRQSRMLKGTRATIAERFQTMAPHDAHHASDQHRSRATTAPHTKPHLSLAPAPGNPRRHPQSDRLDTRPAAHRDTRLRPGGHHQQGHLPGDLRTPQRRRSRRPPQKHHRGRSRRLAGLRRRGLLGRRRLRAPARHPPPGARLPVLCRADPTRRPHPRRGGARARPGEHGPAGGCRPHPAGHPSEPDHRPPPTPRPPGRRPPP